MESPVVAPDHAAAAAPAPARPAEDFDLLAMGDRLSRLERAQIRLVRATLRSRVFDRAVRLFQRTIGRWWIRGATARIRHVHGLDRLPAWDAARGVLAVSNHRSFFDLYVITAELVTAGLPHRVLFPVRSTFFYDHPLGPLVNGAMSFFAMYPPIFRDKKRAALNLAALDEIARLLRGGGVFVGIHPEGTRKMDDDPYTLLPAQTGVGRVVHKARVPVVPVFINGLGNSFVRQFVGGITAKAPPIHIVFGKAIDFGGLLDLAPSPKAYRRIADACTEAIVKLGQEEKRIREGGAGSVDAAPPPRHTESP